MEKPTNLGGSQPVSPFVVVAPSRIAWLRHCTKPLRSVEKRVSSGSGPIHGRYVMPYGT